PAPASARQAGQGNGDGPSQAGGAAHGQHISGGGGGSLFREVAFEQGGPQDITAGGGGAGQGRAGEQVEDRPGRPQQHPQAQQGHRGKQAAFVPVAAGQWRRGQRHHGEGKQRKGGQHAGGSRAQVQLDADQVNQRRDAGQRRA